MKAVHERWRAALLSHTHPAFFERLFRAVGYASAGLTGVAVVVAVPSAIGFELGWWVITWAAFLMAGLPAAVAGWRGRYRTEYVCLPFLAGALVTYAIYEWISAYYQPLNMAAALLITAYAATAFTRFVHLHALVRAREE